MNIFKQDIQISKFIYTLLRYTENLFFLILYIISKITFQKEVCILLYHSIGYNKYFDTVTPEEFYRQIDYLRSNYQIISLDDVIEFINGSMDLDKAVSITFDDGYYDNYQNAYPILKKYDLPATIFLTTGFIDRSIENGNLKFLLWNQIKKMKDNNIEFGAHTITHPDLTEIDLEEVKKEILGSSININDNICKKVKYFAYPFNNYNFEITQQIKKLGFQGAFAGEGIIQNNDDPYTIKRVEVTSAINFLMFKARITKATEWNKYVENIIKSILIKLKLTSLVYVIIKLRKKHLI